MFKNTEVLAKNSLNSPTGTFCKVFPHICEKAINVLFSDTSGQKNYVSQYIAYFSISFDPNSFSHLIFQTMLPTYVCHTPAGASMNQVLHYAQELNLGFFGRFMTGNKMPANFHLERITSPISLHYSTIDTFTNPIDMKRLMSALNRTSDLNVQKIDGIQFDHADFLWGRNTADLVFPEVLKFFARHQ